MTVMGITILLFVLLGFGVPVGFAMAAAGGIGLYIIGGFNVVFGVFQATPVATIGVYELITIPMFLLMAELVLVSGIVDDLFRAMAAWVGRVRGGLGMATAFAGAGFGAICGSSTASAATLSTTSLPAMLKQGYDPKVAGGVVAISGTLAMLIPPSVAMVIYGLLADVDIGKLLIAGVIPALVVTFIIAATVYIIAWRDPSAAPPGKAVPFREKLAMLRVIGPMLLLFGAVTGVIYAGIATPTEASALGAFGALVLAIYGRKLTVATFTAALIRAARSSCMIAMILIGAHIFGYFFALTNVTQDLVAWVGALEVNRWVIMILLLLGYIILGSFMDQIAILVLTVPVVLPLIVSLGFDPIWFGVVKIVVAEMGLVTPPIGLNCYVVARYANRPVGEVFHGIVPHFIAHVFAIAMFLIFPELVMWLPNNMR